MKETMTAEERLTAAISCRVPDRVPCAPLIESYAARYVGITNHRFMFDLDAAMDAFNEIHNDFPVWDCNRSIYFARYGPVSEKIGNTRVKMPGVELPPDALYQFHEYEAMTRDDYDVILNEGFKVLLERFWHKVHGSSPQDITEAQAKRIVVWNREIEESKRRGQAFLYGSLSSLPSDTLSMMRSIQAFFKDLFQIPDKVEAALDIVTDFLIASHKKAIASTGIKTAFIAGTRCSGQFLSKKNFERFTWPYLKKMVNELVDDGNIIYLHFDSNWTMNLEYLLDLPRGKVVLECDSTTDIFKAKEILHGHTCILGDVPPAMMTVGSAQEIDDYCKKLFQVVGKDGGFIFSTGCTLPMNAKNENVKAFFESVKKYGWYF